MTELKIISGSAHKSLANRICKNLDIPLTKVKISQFADGEKYVQILQNVREDTVFVIQPISPPVNDNLVELLIMIDALKRASAKKIFVVAPYLGYSRQDRKSSSREPITAKLVANLLTTAGVDRVCTIDLHQDQIQGFYDIPVDHFKGVPIIANHLASLKLTKNLVVAAPDVGGTKRARDLAQIFKAPIAIIHKERGSHNKSKILNLVGEVKGKVAVIIDDIVDTGGTITNAANEIKKRGAKEVIICATHPVLSNNATELLKKSKVSKVVFLDTIKIPKTKYTSKFEVIKIDNLLSEMIRRIYNGESLGHLQAQIKERVRG